jgi:hypothetical protein
MKHSLSREQFATISNGILSMVLIVVVLQLWLLTATLNAVQGGDASVNWPAAVASLVCLVVNVSLVRYLSGLEKAPVWPRLDGFAVIGRECRRLAGALLRFRGAGVSPVRAALGMTWVAKH